MKNKPPSTLPEFPPDPPPEDSAGARQWMRNHVPGWYDFAVKSNTSEDQWAQKARYHYKQFAKGYEFHTRIDRGMRRLARRLRAADFPVDESNMLETIINALVASGYSREEVMPMTGADVRNALFGILDAHEASPNTPAGRSQVAGQGTQRRQAERGSSLSR